jgi:hypothetical protein
MMYDVIISPADCYGPGRQAALWKDGEIRFCSWQELFELMIAVSDADPPLSTRFNLASTIHRLSQRLGAAQRSIRPLEAVAWGEEIEHRFLRDKGRELPAVSRDTYRSQPLPFDPRRKLDELQDLERDIALALGTCDGIGRVLTRMCRQYASVVHMLAFRGTKTFVSISTTLYGSATDADAGLRRWPS